MSFIQVEERVTELSFIGKWKSFEGEIISVSFNENNQPYFRRFYDNQLVSEGNFTVEENFIVIQRRDTTDMYKATIRLFYRRPNACRYEALLGTGLVAE